MNQIKLNLKLEKCKKFAMTKKGVCLSVNYVDNKTKMLWQCEKGHQWEARWNNIKDFQQWCPQCARQTKPTINELQEFAKNKNGKLLSLKYKNNKSNLLWQCEQEHLWEASWANIRYGNTWCLECSGKNICNINDLKLFAKNKNGKLLSTQYINNSTKMLWECSEGHQWEARWHDIQSKNSWCPECSRFKIELKCNEILEEKFKVKFVKTRFYYDLNSNKKFIEFDGYNKNLNIAFEYHGYQHYEYPNRWHKTKEEFLDQCKRDEFKEQFAAENNIKLIIIPYTVNDLETFINNYKEF